MKKNEAKKTREFLHRRKHNHIFVAEFKDAGEKKSLPFSSLKPHQKHALLAATGKEGIVYKLPDTGYAHKPFDAFHIRQVPAHVLGS